MAAMRSRISRAKVVCLIALSAAGMGSHFASAADQTVPATDQTAATGTGGGGEKLQEVVVTARRREENVQQVPIAIDVVSQETIQANNITTIGDLQRVVAGLSTLTGQSRTDLNVSIRGQQVGATAPGVGIYVDEVLLPYSLTGVTVNTGNNAQGLFFDLENVQVLKGPQGTLFGRDSVGGDILLQTARPTREFGGHVEVTYGNYKDREVNGVVNIPVVGDVLLARVAFTGQLTDGFTYLMGDPVHPNGIDADNRDQWTARATIAFKPGAMFENDTMVMYSHYRDNGAPEILADVDPKGLIASIFPQYYSDFLQQQALGPRTAIPVSAPLPNNGSSLMVSNTTHWAITDDIQFRNIFGYGKVISVSGLDIDATQLPLIDLRYPIDAYVTQYTEEAQLLGKAFGSRLDWIAGIYYLDQPTPADYIWQAATIFGGISDVGSKPGVQSRAAFAQGTYDLSSWIPHLKLTAGARYTRDTLSNTTIGGNGAVCVSPPAVMNCNNPQHGTAESSAPTYTVGLDYQAATDTLLYITARRGYRPGGYNFTNNAAYGEYKPEYVNDIELGVKSDWSVGNAQVRTNGDVWYQDYSSIQVAQVVCPPNALCQSVTQNAAGARLWGAELEALAHVTKGLELGANLASLHFEYTQFGQGVDGAQLTATQYNNRPKFQYSVHARYQLPIDAALGDLSMQATWTWRGENTSCGDPVGCLRPSGIIASYGLLGATIDWVSIARGPVDLSLFGSNLLNETYVVGGSNNWGILGFATLLYGEPRMYGARVRYRF